MMMSYFVAWRTNAYLPHVNGDYATLLDYTRRILSLRPLPEMRENFGGRDPTQSLGGLMADHVGLG